MATRTCAHTAAEHREGVWGVVYEPGGSAVASVGDDKLLCIYDVM